MTKYKVLLIVLLSFFFLSCNKGLEPPEVSQSAVLSIDIRFDNDWPNKDSIYGLRVAAFKLPPSQNLISEVFNGNAEIKDIDSEYGSKNFNTNFVYDNLPIELKYIVVAWQYDSLLTSQKIVGVYNKTNYNEPSLVTLNSGDSINIVIEVDWNDFPPQPF